MPHFSNRFVLVVRRMLQITKFNDDACFLWTGVSELFAQYSAAEGADSA